MRLLDSICVVPNLFENLVWYAGTVLVQPTSNNRVGFVVSPVGKAMV